MTTPRQHTPLCPCRGVGRVAVRSPVYQTRYCPVCGGGRAYVRDQARGGQDRRRGWAKVELPPQTPRHRKPVSARQANVQIKPTRAGTGRRRRKQGNPFTKER